MSSSHVKDFVLVVGAAVRRGHVSVDGCWDVTAVLVVVRQSEAEQTGACGQVHVLNMLHIGPTHRTQLKLAGTGLTAHHMSTRTEGSINLLLAAEHAEQSISELLQPFLELSALLAAATVQGLLQLVVPGRGP